jgi:hypothetical protein
MECREFEAVVHDLNRFATLDRKTREAAQAHERICSRCAALREAGYTLETSLRTLALVDAEAEAPDRVEAALREAFQSNRPRVLKVRRIRAWAWGLATAAAVALVVLGWFEWQAPQDGNRTPEVAQAVTSEPSAASANGAGQQGSVNSGGAGTAESASSAEADESGFLPLPYSTLSNGDEEADVVRVRMARGELAAFGLPVNAERADDTIDVDFLVAADGTPEAVRLPD